MNLRSPTVPTGLRMVLTLGATGMMLGAALVWTQSSAPPNQGGVADGSTATEARAETGQTGQGLREGTRIAGQLGHFRITGDRVTFFAAGGTGRFVCLENLNLERIARAIEEDPARLEWNVAGRVTEYRGANYLAVECAILTAGRKVPAAKSSR